MDQKPPKIIGASFIKDWDGTIKVPHLAALKKPDESLNIKHLLPLEANTPFGNLHLSWISLVTRTQLINEAIDDVNHAFDVVQELIKNPIITSDSNVYIRVQMDSEILVYLLRTTADRLIMLLSLEESFSANAKYPNKIECDSVAGYLHYQPGQFCSGLIDSHREMLEALNIVANSFKHSFLNLQTTNILMKNTPGVIAMYQPHNDLSKESVLGHIIFVNTVREFDLFSNTIRQYLESALVEPQ